MFPRTEHIKSGVVENLDVLNSLTFQGVPVVPGGGGAVDSVNGYTGVVVLAHTDVGAAAASHSHIIADVTGLQTALDGKSATSHTHAIDDLSDVTITAVSSGHTLSWNGSAWVNGTPAGQVEYLTSTFRLVDNTTPTKKQSHQISSYTAATTRNIVWPNRDVNVDFITSTVTQTSSMNAYAILHNSLSNTVQALDCFTLSGGNAAPVLQVGGNQNTRQTGAAGPNVIIKNSYYTVSANAADSGPAFLFDGWLASQPRDMARIDALWTDATDATRSSRLVFSTVHLGTALAERLRISSDGTQIQTGTVAGTNATVVTQLVQLNSTGTVAANFGSAYETQLESANGTMRPASRILTTWETATDLSRRAKLEIQVIQDATSSYLTILSANGTGTTTLGSSSGIINIPGASAKIHINSTQVLQARETGWTAGTGTANKGAINYDTVAFDVTGFRSLAQRVLALENMLRTHGLIN